MLRRAAGVISGKAISRFLSAIGRLGRSKFIAHPPSRAPARTARSSGIARSAPVTAVMPVYSIRALTGPICLAIELDCNSIGRSWRGRARNHERRRPRNYGEMPGVTPVAPPALVASSPPAGGSAETVPAPGSSGVTAPPPLVANRPADAEYGAALALAGIV